MATLDSHRVATDAPLVRVGAASAVIRCAVVHEGRELLVELEIVPGKANRARLGRSPARRARDVLGALRLVLFAPEDLELVRGRPGRARGATSTTCWSPGSPGSPACGPTTSGWSSSATPCCAPPTWPARPAASRGGDLSTLDVWDTHLAQHGAELLAGRLELVAGARPARGEGVRRGGRRPWRGRRSRTRSSAGRSPMPDRSGAGGGAAGVAGGVPYVRSRARGHAGRPAPRRPDADAWARCRPRGTPATASRGRSRWRCGWPAYDLLRADGIEPVLVLDDVFAELDAGRRERLAELVGGASQLLVTCAVDDDVPVVLRGARYEVAEGDGAPCRMSFAPDVRRLGRRRGRPTRRWAARSWPGPCSTPRRPGATPAVPGASRRPRPSSSSDGGGDGAPRRKRLRGYSGPGPDPRDPQLFGAVLERLVKARGWQKPAAEATVFGAWERVVGPDVAAAQPAGQAGGRRADRRGRVDRLGDPAAAAGRRRCSSASRPRSATTWCTKLHIHGPAAPSWSRRAPGGSRAAAPATPTAELSCASLATRLWPRATAVTLPLAPAGAEPALRRSGSGRRSARS